MRRLLDILYEHSLPGLVRKRERDAQSTVVEIGLVKALCVGGASRLKHKSILTGGDGIKVPNDYKEYDLIVFTVSISGRAYLCAVPPEEIERRGRTILSRNHIYIRKYQMDVRKISYMMQQRMAERMEEFRKLAMASTIRRKEMTAQR